MLPKGTPKEFYIFKYQGKMENYKFIISIYS